MMPALLTLSTHRLLLHGVEKGRAEVSGCASSLCLSLLENQMPEEGTLFSRSNTIQHMPLLTGLASSPCLSLCPL